jgi:5'-deoxynucleotidase YfbR-like HD superfamily hydrolase
MKRIEEESIELIKFERQMRHVQRLSGTPILKPYSIAEHCYFTGLLFMEVAERDNVSVTLKDIKKVFMHDILEVKTGDLLYPAKHSNAACEKNWDEIEQIVVNKSAPLLAPYMDDAGWSSKEAQALFKVCDLLELFMFCRDEQAIGNYSVHMRNVRNNCRSWLPKMLADLPFAKELAEAYAG